MRIFHLRIIHIITVPVFALLILLSSATGARRAEILGYGDYSGIPGASPMVSFLSVSLGGFRGLIADILWLRASRLQQHFEFIELVQLSEWIAMLQPRNDDIWVYHSWNMAYNVSTIMSSDNERWRWVGNGIRLLRHDGLRMNPGRPALYHAIGWIYFHKIGDSMDDSHNYYKKELAAGVEAILPGGMMPGAGDAGSADAAVRMDADFGMDMGLMREIEGRYGRLDWRVAEAHALYWGYAGLQTGTGVDDEYCRRLVFQSLAVMFMRGSISGFDEDGTILFGPRPGIYPGVVRAYDEGIRHGVYNAETAKRHFMGVAAVVFENIGNTGRADEIRLELKRLEGPGR